MDGRGGQASAIALVFGETLVEAAFMDERTNKDQRPRCFRIETAADQERNETRGWREGPRTTWGPPRWTPSGVSGRVRLRRQRGGVPQSTSTAGVPTAVIWPSAGAGRGAGQGRSSGNLWQISGSPARDLRAAGV